MIGYNRRTIPENNNSHDKHNADSTALYLLAGISGMVIVLLLVV